MRRNLYLNFLAFNCAAGIPSYKSWFFLLTAWEEGIKNHRTTRKKKLHMSILVGWLFGLVGWLVGFGLVWIFWWGAGFFEIVCFFKYISNFSNWIENAESRKGQKERSKIHWAFTIFFKFSAQRKIHCLIRAVPKYDLLALLVFISPLFLLLFLCILCLRLISFLSHPW